MVDVIRVSRDDNPTPEARREWLVTNGLGGFASATISGEITRRYHGFLIAALPAPQGRVVMLNDLDVAVGRSDGSLASLRDSGRFVDFTLTMGLPSWRYEIDGMTIEKSVLMPARHNITYIGFRLIGGARAIRLFLRPAVNFRRIEAAVSEPLALGYALTANGRHYEIAAGSGLPVLRLMISGCDATSFTADGGSRHECDFVTEEQRGYDARGSLWSPGYFTVELQPDSIATLIAATEPWHTVEALHPDAARRFETERRRRLVAMAPPAAREGLAAELVLAADSFIITPVGRVADIVRAHAEGDEMRTVIAGYHWFTDWGRDAMISLEGLTLATGRVAEGKWILRAFAHYVRDGLIPNMFPEGDCEGLYHTADATLWFFHALARYVEYTGDRATLTLILPKLQEIVRLHLEGTRFGIKADPRDGLLSQGAEGYQLTWMDAKVGDWVVTPRRGKAVEINALWYNALSLLTQWLRDARHPEADEIAGHAELTRQSFNRRFWNESRGCLYDVVDGENGDDASFRPNQIFAVSLPHPVLDRQYWRPVVDAVEQKLLTPFGLRSLAPDEPDFKSRYFGDLRARDAAYHQGTVWAWLIGPFIDAWLKVHPDKRETARGLLAGFETVVAEAGIGSISEIFDAEPPFTPRGCMAQAWSVAEVLRCLVKTAP
ncbi:MAG: glycogen debranching protein [Alphaproteobacteria bacterium 13_1_20CM_3_64_12]|nr:MAG: glycogen debranching protein [Alphaproteobacteria bacterium 13_1_20CM_3_64_12]